MVLGIDTETTGLKHSHGHRAFLVAYSDKEGVIHAKYTAVDDLKEIEDLAGDTSNEWVGHNIGFDLPFLHDHNIIIRGTLHDTMIMAHIHNNLEPAKDLATLAEKYCGIKNTEDAVLDKWFKDNGYNKDNRAYIDVPDSIIVPYAKADIRRTLALFEFYKSKGVLDNPAYHLEMKVVPVVAKIAARGMCVDKELAKVELNKAVATMAAIELDVLMKYNIKNIDSPQQIADVLFTQAGLTCTTHTDKGNICLDASALTKYEHPLVEQVLTHRQINKLTSTYLTAIIEKSHEGRLHSSLKQVGAKTGRFASSDPNLQNVPRTDEASPVNIRRVFVCDKGSRLLLIDLSQIELRILAHYSKEPSMIATLKERKGDIHTTTAIQMFGEVNSDLRTVAKTLNFAVLYGAGGAALVEQLNKALPNRKVSLAQAKEFKQKFFKGYPLVQEFLWKIQTLVIDSGYVFGVSGKKYFCEKDKAYKASNYLIQGESAMLMKQMMVDVETYLDGRMTQLINVIHDEFIFDLHETDEDCISGLLHTIERPEGWRVPIYANAAISSTNWAEKKGVV